MLLFCRVLFDWFAEQPLAYQALALLPVMVGAAQVMRELV